MAKSMLHAIVGTLVDEGRLDPERPAPVPEWAVPATPAAAITLDHLLAMRDGLDFVEDYVDGQIVRRDRDALRRGQGRHGRLRRRPPAGRDPRAASSTTRAGTTNVAQSHRGRPSSGPATPTSGFLAERLFGPLGMTSAAPRPSIRAGSSWPRATCTPRRVDFARFGLLYLRGGVLGRSAHPRAGAGSTTPRRPPLGRPTDGTLYWWHWWVTGDELRHLLGERLRGPADHRLPRRSTRWWCASATRPTSTTPTSRTWWRRVLDVLAATRLLRRGSRGRGAEDAPEGEALGAAIAAAVPPRSTTASTAPDLGPGVCATAWAASSSEVPAGHRVLGDHHPVARVEGPGDAPAAAVVLGLLAHAERLQQPPAGGGHRRR